MQYISGVHLSYNNENIIGASEASPLVSHARGPGALAPWRLRHPSLYININ